MSKPKLLLTGFEKFADYPINPTASIVESFDLETTEIRKVILPVDFDKVRLIYNDIVTEYIPDLIINLGLSAKAMSMNLETFALNIGKDIEPTDSSFDIEPTGEMAFRTALDTDSYAQEIRSMGVPAVSSHYAGSYLCNYVFYQSLQWTTTHGGDALFVHIPFTSALVAQIYEKEQKEYCSLGKKSLLTGLKIIVERWLKQRPLA